MDVIRLANEAEVKEISSRSDLTNASSVVTFGGKDFAVIRNCWEIDPVHFDPASSDKRKALFLMNLETALRLQGVKEFYFNVDASDENYINLLKHWGAEPTNPNPEIRFKKAL